MQLRFNGEGIKIAKIFKEITHFAFSGQDMWDSRISICQY